MYFYTALEHTSGANILESDFRVLLKMRVFSPQTVPSSLTPRHSSHNTVILLGRVLSTIQIFVHLSPMQGIFVRLLKINYAGFVPHNQISAC